jgi:hypothetical protein
MVALRSPRRPTAPAPAIEQVADAAPVAPIMPPPAPPPDSPLLDNLESARDSIPPLAQEEAAQSALQQQMAALKLAELRQQERAQEFRANLAANMQQEPKQQEAPQLSEKDREWLGARPGVERDPNVAQAAQALGFVYGAGTDDFYHAMSLKFPISNYRRIEPKQSEDAPAHHPTPEPEAPPTRPRIPVQAPVSRSEPGGSYTPSPSSVKLSATEREIARASGQSDTEYAKMKIKLAELKKAGHYNEQN